MTYSEQETLDKALRFLEENKDLALATAAQNMPHLRLFQVMKREGKTLYFATSHLKDVYKEIMANPYIELLSWRGDISVRCTGTVVHEVEPSIQQWIYEHNDVLSRLYTSYDQLTYFALPIEKLDYYDLAPTPPHFLHFDFKQQTVGKGFVGNRFEK